MPRVLGISHVAPHTPYSDGVTSALQLQLTVCFHSRVARAKAVRFGNIPGLAPDGGKRTLQPWLGGQPFHSHWLSQDLEHLAGARKRPSPAAIFRRPPASAGSLNRRGGSPGASGESGAQWPGAAPGA